MRLERYPFPRWIVVGAGTGGTSATVGRYVRYRQFPAGVAVVDPENCTIFESWATANPAAVTGIASRMEGIGRPRVEASFVPGVVAG